MKKWKRIVQILLVAVIGIMLAFPTFADDLFDAKQKQKELEQELSDSEAKLEELKENVESAQQAVDEIDSEIAAVEAVISDYELQKENLETKIDELQKQIDEKQVEIEHEYDMMSKRIKFLYENLGNSYVEAFLTSETFSDALNKVQYLIELSDYDRKQMETLEKLQKGIEKDQAEVEEEKEGVESLISAQNDQKDVLDGMLAVKAEALQTAQEAQAIAEEQNAAIAQMLEEQKETVDQLVEEYNERLKEQLRAQMQAQGSGVEPEGEIIFAPGGYIWPLPSPYYSNYITSRFGWRGDPFGGGYADFHGGLDIGAPCNTPIMAVADGTVIISQDGWNGGCGNYTVIYHGGGVYTEYMHQNYRAVYVGQAVLQGEVIGYVGTTGSSTGYHLHIGFVMSDHGFDTSCRVDPGPILGAY
ncbi:MAG: peptidoglycan DD-metalloendopeptidase family protein [Parasporobacterium sp.]|nr:peptidoglycan DD-metalloendopeptidase family protein [Parasporobacterium sp.]